ncbi:MAG: hypothetical protein QOF90_1453 [Acetobacteraceae bacterium]|nr:hypothetical protein [Acetobacteraceae bacterium]
MSEARLPMHPIGLAAHVKYSQARKIVRRGKPIGDIGAKFPTSQLHVQKRDIGTMLTHETDCVVHPANDPTYAMTNIQQRVF